jgi:hypothetical protein
MIESEADLLAAMTHHDDLVRRCVRGELSFVEFCEAYDNFYFSAALDGHESSTRGRALLQKHEARIRPHRIIANAVLARVCSDEDAERDVYKQAGRFGSAEALARLKRLRLPSM